MPVSELAVIAVNSAAEVTTLQIIMQHAMRTVIVLWVSPKQDVTLNACDNYNAIQSRKYTNCEALLRNDW